MTPKGADLEATDLIEVSTIESGSYVTRSITGQELIDAIPLPPTGLTIGTTPISSGTIGRVLFQGTGNVLQQSGNFFWDETNARLGIGIAAPTVALDVNSFINFRSQIRGIQSGGDVFIYGNNSSNVNDASRINLRNQSDGSLNLGNKYPSAYISFEAGNNAYTERMRINNSTGNVAINTTTDAGFRLDVNGTARVQDNLLLTNGIIATSTATTRLQGSLNYFTHNRIGSSGALGFQISQTSTLSSFWRWTDATNDVEFGNARNASLSLWTNNTVKATITGGGNVLINTTTDAGFKLDVNGTARVKGTGTTIGTTSFTVQDSASSDLFRVYDNGLVAIKAGVISLNGSNGSITGGFIASTGQMISGGTSITPSAQMEVISTTRGFLPPRMTTTQRNAIASPAAGLVVYDNTDNKHYGYNGTTWNAFY